MALFSEESVRWGVSSGGREGGEHLYGPPSVS